MKVSDVVIGFQTKPLAMCGNEDEQAAPILRQHRISLEIQSLGPSWRAGGLEYGVLQSPTNKRTKPGTAWNDIHLETFEGYATPSRTATQLYTYWGASLFG
jgi:hypothetical protein